MAVDWRTILRVDVDRLDPNDPNIESELETLYPILVKGQVDLDDALATPENLVRLFRLTQSVMELKNLYLESAEKQIQDDETSLQVSEAEIVRLKNLGMGGNASEIRSLRADLEDLEKRNMILAQDAQIAQETLDMERKNVVDLTMAIRDEKSRSAALNASLERLQVEYSHVNTQLGAHAERATARRADDEDFRSQLKEKNAEINRYLTEIQLLTTDNAQLRDDVESLGSELEVAVAELERAAREREDSRQVITKSDAQIDSLSGECDSLRIRVGELEDELRGYKNLDESRYEDANTEVARIRKTMRDSQMDLNDKDKTIRKLQMEVANLRAGMEEAAIDSLRKSLTERDETIQQLKASLERSERDFALLAMDWDQLESVNAAKTAPETLMAHQSEIGRLKENAEAYHSKHLENLKRLKLLEDQEVDREREVVDLRARMEKYEEGTYGLREASREIKELQLQRSMRDKEILDLTKRANDFEAQICDFLEENSELRRRLGIDEKTTIDTSNLNTKKHIELEQVKALNQTLRGEVERLEEERVLLKSQLRMRALEQGQRAVELGLTAEELIDLEDYTDRLRSKSHVADKSSAPAVVHHTVIHPTHAPTLDKLALELERVHVESAESRIRIMQMEDECRVKSQEIEALSAAVRELSDMLSSRRRRTQSGTREQLTEEQLPAVQQLLLLLSNRVGSSHGTTMDSVTPSLLHTSRGLESDLRYAEDRIIELEQELERSKRNSESWQTQLEAHVNERKNKILSCPRDLRLASQDVLIETVVELGAELTAKDKALLELKGDVSHWKNVYGTISGQMKKVYRENHDLQQKFNDEVANVRHDAAEVSLDLENANARAQEWESTASLMQKGSDSDIRREIVECQRKFITMKVNETALIRKYKVLEDCDARQRKELTQLKDDFSSLEAASLQRIGHLQASFKSASSRVEHLEQEISCTVAASDHAKIVSKLESEIARNRLLLERERSWEEKAQQGIDAENLRHELDKSVAEVKGLQAQIESANASINSVSIERGAESTSSLHQQLGQLTASVAVLSSRCETAESRAERHQKESQQLQRRAEDAEKRYLEATQELMHYRGEELKTARPDEGLVKEARQLKDDRDRLASEIQHYKLTADVSSQQALDLKSRLDRDKKDFELLKTTIRELQNQSDDKMVIGKLHNHIIALQASETEALKKASASERRLLKLDTTVAELERALDDRDACLFKARHDCRSTINDLRKTVQSMRLRLAGSVTLERYQRACDQLHLAYVQTKAMNDEVAHLLNSNRTLEAQFAEKQLREELDRELASLLNNPTAAKERLVEWQKRMAEMRIADAAMSRENAALRQDLTRARSSVESEKAEAQKLAEKLMGLQAEFDERQLDWEQRQTDLEMSLVRLQEERELIFRAASSSELKDTLPDRTLPLANQLDAAIQLLLERAKQSKAYQFQLSCANERIKELEVHSKHQEGQINAKDVEIVDLRCLKNDGDVRLSQVAVSRDDLTRSIVQEAESASALASRELIESLQRQLEHKEQMLQKYANRLKQSQEAVTAQKMADEREIAHLTKIINTLNDGMIERLKKPADKIQSHSDSNPDAGTITELEHLVAAKDVEILHLSQRVQELTAEVDGWKSKLTDVDSYLGKEQEKWSKALDDMESEKVDLLGKVAEARAAAAEAPPKTLERQVKRLKTDLSTRDLKIKSLERAIEQIKATAIAKAREPLTDGQESRLSSASTRIVQLEAKLDKLKKVAASHLEERDKWEKDRRTLSDDISNLTNKIRDAESKMLEANLERDKMAHGLRVLSLRVPPSSRAQSTEPFELGASPAIGSPTTPVSPEVERIEKISSAEPPSLPPRVVTFSSRPNSAPAVMASPVQSSPAEAPVSARQKWELDHKTRVKVDTLREKLEEKKKEAETALRQLASLRPILEKAERERLRLQKKVVELSSMPKLDLGIEREKEVRHTLEVEELRKKIADLQSEVARWKKVAEVDATNEISRLKQEKSQVQDKLDTLQTLHEHLQRDLGDLEDSVLERRIATLLEQNHVFQEEGLKKDTELVQIRAERDVAKASSERLEHRILELEESLNKMRLNVTTSNESDYGIRLPNFFIPLPVASHPSVKASRETEMAQVIDHLSKSLEKAHKDVELLRAKATSDKRYMEIVKECKQLKTERDDAVQKISARSNDANVERVESENQKLRTQLRKESSKLQKEARRAIELEEENKRLKLEGQGLRRVVGEVATREDVSDIIDRLRSQLAEKEVQLRALQESSRSGGSSHDGPLSDPERRKLLRELELWKTRVAKMTTQFVSSDGFGGLAGTSNRLDELEQENRELRNELQAFDPNFFEELEDLKFSHRQARDDDTYVLCNSNNVNP
ncbi:hypothetical protein SmJEL517_g00935 [Synchytrium microbalum]|uniref:Uncharacterized protein n=1 Tax=Synchytrium microbalum TaxID=1806994 RepID=A0A507CC45_9FUNG|nr:uncharacterized protein SmJEL517_g00935 [Synchytrium microbalum]TPX37071.1 hypothetical protein SmJEL517_g00935 [Synchytrium microbalum]